MQIGKLLKEVRKEKGLTVAQVANDLLVQEKYIIAIESGNFEAIPGETYQRAYFKKYAEYLGISEYIDNLAKSKDYDEMVEEVPDDAPWGGEWDTSRWMRVSARIIAILVIIILIPMGIYRMARGSNAPEQPDPDNRVESTQQVHVLPTDAYPLDFVHEPEPDTVPISDSLTHQINLRATGECWVELNTNDGELYKGMMVRGDDLTFDDIFGFKLKTGRPEVLEVYFNGELVEWQQGQTVMDLPEGIFVLHEAGDSEPEPEPEDSQDNDTSSGDSGDDGTGDGSENDGGDEADPEDEAGSEYWL